MVYKMMENWFRFYLNLVRVHTLSRWNTNLSSSRSRWRGSIRQGHWSLDCILCRSHDRELKSIKMKVKLWIWWESKKKSSISSIRVRDNKMKWKEELQSLANQNIWAIHFCVNVHVKEIAKELRMRKNQQDRENMSKRISWKSKHLKTWGKNGRMWKRKGKKAGRNKAKTMKKRKRKRKYWETSGIWFCDDLPVEADARKSCTQRLNRRMQAKWRCRIFCF